MPVLVLLLVVVCVLLLSVLLLPLSLFQRYRRGKARRRLVRWVFKLNAVLMPISLGMLLLGAWLWQLWHPLMQTADTEYGIDGMGALGHVLAGCVAGGLLGVLGVLLTRVHRQDGHLFYTPNRWLVLALTVLVAVRIGVFFWQAWQGLGSGVVAGWSALDHRPLFALGGLLLSYAWTYGIGLLRRTRVPVSGAR